RRQRDAGPTKHLAGIPKEKKAKVEAVKRNVCRKLNFDPKHPWDHTEYVNLMIEEYGGGCGVMQLMDEGVVPRALLL
ncbi:MAG: hypothetical protein GY737_27720, partial [Desulfobacteraceae bacterium]|nr:hypothetical protein [Desulfobacteraceae bacterium]